MSTKNWMVKKFYSLHSCTLLLKGCTIKPVFSGPSDEGTPAVLGHFAWHGLVFNCKHPVIRGHLPNANRGQTNREISHVLPGMRGQFAICEYLLNINFYSSSADFIDLAGNSPCGSGRMVKVEPEAMHECCFSTLKSIQG